MTFIKADKEKLNLCADSFEKDAIGYNQAIAEYFKKIRDIPELTKDWKGDVADSYVQLILSREQKYIDFGDSLMEFADLLKKSANSLEECINKSQIDGGE